jgi:SAM-dependent methyltransferase
MNKWLDKIWFTDIYQQHKKENFDVINLHLTSPPTTILDIGCGLAWESRLFNQKYGTKLWLLDGDIKNNDVKPRHARDGGYNTHSTNFLYYLTLQQLDNELKKLDTQNYHLIDCNNIKIDQNIKFDLITSWVSCGFHYPSSTYRELILKHSHPNTKIIFDIRIPTKQKHPIEESGIEIVQVLNTRSKYVTAEIAFI